MDKPGKKGPVCFLFFSFQVEIPILISSINQWLHYRYKYTYILHTNNCINIHTNNCN